jgi:hypothetical protein
MILPSGSVAYDCSHDADTDRRGTKANKQFENLHEKPSESKLPDAVRVDAVVDPLAVVVQMFDAPLALLAVVHSRVNVRLAELAVVVVRTRQPDVETALLEVFRL